MDKFFVESYKALEASKRFDRSKFRPIVNCFKFIKVWLNLVMRNDMPQVLNGMTSNQTLATFQLKMI